MNQYIISSLIAFVLVGMGLVAMIVGTMNYNTNKNSASSEYMYHLLFDTFLWTFGYAWMSLCYNSDFAYIPRAIALFGVISYMFFLIRYVSELVNIKPKLLYLYYIIFWIASVPIWINITGKDAVTFTMTPWGYWYVSKMTIWRMLQFATILSALVVYYVIIVIGIRRAKLKRERYIYKGYLWFGPILVSGYVLDTILPSLFDIPAIPASAVASFFATMLLFNLSNKYKGFGISKDNISEFVFQDVSVPVIITDNENKIALYNECVPKFFERTDEELIGALPEVIYKKNENSEVVKYTRQNGETIEFKISKSEIIDRFGELMYTINFIQDMTQEQNHLRALEESRIEAEHANMAKTNFLANMSHEIRTPMNAILGMSEIILQNNPDNEVVDGVADIKIAAKNLLGIINDILDISKIESGKYEIIQDDYRLSDLLNDVCSIIRVRVQESNTKLVIELDETLPNKVFGDQLRLRQLLLNILGNAVKFTKQGTITLRAFWNNDIDNPELCFDVSDTGIGIKDEDIDKIFGAFNQVDTRRNRSIQGTGLGLAISKELAKLMGGDITVDSIYGEGSTFHIVIKQIVNEYEKLGKNLCESIAKGTFSVMKAEETVEEIKRPNAKVLVVDDVDMNLVIAQGLLQKYDINADIAMSGKEAIEMVTKNDYDLIFMDHMMPEMDGIDTTKSIRKLEKDNVKDLPIIALTANAINEAKELFMKEGMQDFLAKPIDPKLLDEIILKWL